MSIYTVHILIGQRICAYEGEYAPEVIASADEFTNEDNPDWLIDERKKAEDSKEFSSIALIEVELPFDAVLDRLNPKTLPIPGTIKA